MHPTSIVIAFLLLAGLAAVLLEMTRSASPRYRARALMTGNELEFFRRLRRALPDEYIFPQVALSALIDPVSKGKQFQYDFRRISQKRVDYAIYTPDLRLVAIVELDDRTHSTTRDAQRDRFTASAGIRTVRFESRRKPDEAQIRAAVYPDRGQRSSTRAAVA